MSWLSRSENTSVSSSREYWMLLTWHVPVPPCAVGVDDGLHGAVRRPLLDVVATVRAVGVEGHGLVGQHRQLVVLPRELGRQIVVGEAVHGHAVHVGRA